MSFVAYISVASNRDVLSNLVESATFTLSNKNSNKGVLQKNIHIWFANAISMLNHFYFYGKLWGVREQNYQLAGDHVQQIIISF